MSREFKIILLTVVLLFVRLSECQFGQNSQQRGIVAGRQDSNYDIIVYINGQPLQANGQINLQAFQQTMGIAFSDGTRIPPTATVVNGQLQTTPTPPGLLNLAINVQRSYFGPIFGK